jgi:soluble lytic murein transglycosylase
VTSRNRTALLAALVALVAWAPLAAAKDEAPDNKAGTKTHARTPDKKSAEKKGPDKKAEKKTHERKAESHDKKDDKRTAKKDQPKDPKKEAKKEAKRETKKEAKKDAKKDTKRKEAKKPPADKRATTIAAAHGDRPRLPMPHARPGFTTPSRSLEFPARPVTASLEMPPAPAAPFVYARPLATGVPLAEATTASTPASDVAAVKQAIGLARKGKADAATSIERDISDPLARKLVEWVILRGDDNDADFARYNAFITANPGWPSNVTFRRRAEAMLWQERASSATVRAYFANTKPLSTKGHFALARALLTDGDRAGAQAYAREAWRSEDFSQDLEGQALELFGSLLSRADEKARMNRSLLTKANFDQGLRAARRLGGDQPAIAKALIAVIAKASNAKSLLDDVPVSARRDAAYVFAHIHWLRQHDKITEAGAAMLSAPRDPAEVGDTNEWWIERRLVARKLLDIGDARTAYAVVRDAAVPSRENYRAEREFTAGWIALRFLHQPALAERHFARVAEGNANPITIARAGYWLGRTAEAENKPHEARAAYEAAARYSTAYYGQLARARLGRSELDFAPPPRAAGERHGAVARLEVVRAAELLYAVDARDLVAMFVADLADKSTDQAALAMLAEIAEHNGDARSVLLIGKIALGRGLPFDEFAFPVGGLPRYSSIGPQVEPAIVYSIARQESAFNPRTVSSAKALGLMQVTPDAGRYIAKKFGVTFDQHRLLHDNVYNVQMGAAELGDDIARYRGSYILAFAGYNAGAGRVKEWVERYGDPRDPRVDPIDWVERIPFSETRNYVERILENLQVYRARFAGSAKLMIEADLRRGLAAE